MGRVPAVVCLEQDASQKAPTNQVTQFFSHQSRWGQESKLHSIPRHYNRKGVTCSGDQCSTLVLERESKSGPSSLTKFAAKGGAAPHLTGVRHRGEVAEVFIN